MTSADRPYLYLLDTNIVSGLAAIFPDDGLVLDMLIYAQGVLDFDEDAAEWCAAARAQMQFEVKVENWLRPWTT